MKKRPQKSLVLLGAGNANLLILRSAIMSNFAQDTRVVLIDPNTVIPYSGMLPGLISGEYRSEECCFDLVKLTGRAGANFIQSVAEKVDFSDRLIHLRNHPPVAYDFLVMNLGSIPMGTEMHAEPFIFSDEKVAVSNQKLIDFPIRPLASLIKALPLIDEVVRRRASELTFSVVGGGAGGVESILAFYRRYSGVSMKFRLIQASSGLSDGLSPGIRKRFLSELQSCGISIEFNKRLTFGVQDREGAEIRIWASGASPQKLVCGLKAEQKENGFIQVDEFLRVGNYPGVFAAGDMIHFPGKRLPKNGVYSVREGQYLCRELPRWIAGEQASKAFRPQRKYLSLFHVGQSKAFGSYGRWSFSGNRVFHWKEKIDRRWMKMCSDFGDETMFSTEAMWCTACGSKAPSDVLSQAIKNISAQSGVSLDLGKENASIVNINGVTVVQSVDFFREGPGDPFLLGQMAAEHALNDLFAVNSDPITAQALVTLKHASSHVQSAQLTAFLSGATKVFSAVGAHLSGGHTIEGAEPEIGFSVTGAEPRQGRLWQKGGLQSGDALISTKPIGGGILLAALPRGFFSASMYEDLWKSLLQSNQKAVEIARQFRVNAATDVSGFGLAGHLLEMALLSGKSLVVQSDSVKLFKGVRELNERGVESSIFESNRRNFPVSLTREGESNWLWDPQTSGPLVFSVPKSEANKLVNRLTAEGYSGSSIIGRVEASTATPVVLVE